MSSPAPEQFVFGSEMEYGCTLNSNELATDERMLHLMGRTIIGEDVEFPPGVNRLFHFLSNGSRLYIDHTHPEYATPECSSLDDLVAANLSGERILMYVLQRQLELGKITDFQLYQRLADNWGASWGYHLNHQFLRKHVSTRYCVQIPETGIEIERRPLDRTKLALLGLHNATHGMYTGAGMVKDGRFYLMQKGLYTTIDYAVDTVLQKPVVNLRDEILIDDDNRYNDSEYVRIHSVSGDASHSPWAIKMQAGTIELVLKLIASGETPDSLGIRLPESSQLHKIMKVVAGDIAMRETVELADGRPIRPIDIQNILCEAAAKLPDLTPDNLWVLKNWKKILNDLDNNSLDTSDRTHWAAKHSLISRKIGKDVVSAISNYSPYYEDADAIKKAKGIDGNFDLSKLGKSVRDPITHIRKVILQDGFGKRWQKLYWQEDMPSDEIIEAGMTESASKDTRAIVRGAFINKVAASPTPTSDRWGVGWERKREGIESESLGLPHQVDRALLERIRAA